MANDPAPTTTNGTPVQIMGYIDHVILDSNGDSLAVHTPGIISVDPLTGKKVEPASPPEVPT